eukprot:TRINITY_DN3904_c0_g8_i1.p1 TRINITY_DN3904_c0_g8~~TRINITY_DN3904_c0_g8_i1.p1  ORF type:complete len:181 (-),score=45.10 TRINITY_DN3904_c0_g8_i1:35-577(-)
MYKDMYGHATTEREIKLIRRVRARWLGIRMVRMLNRWALVHAQKSYFQDECGLAARRFYFEKNANKVLDELERLTERSKSKQQIQDELDAYEQELLKQVGANSSLSSQMMTAHKLLEFWERKVNEWKKAQGEEVPENSRQAGSKVEWPVPDSPRMPAPRVFATDASIAEGLVSDPTMLER